MALSVSSEANVALTTGAATEVVDALVGRKVLCLQLLGPGFAWIKLGGAASKGDGFRIGPYELVNVVWDLGMGDSSGNYYEGAVSVFYEGGAAPGPVSGANLRVLEML